MRKRASVGALAVLSLVAGLVMAITSGSVASAAANDQPLSGTASSMWQTNNTVYAVAAGGGRLYAGGIFTSVRPPGAAAGTQQTTRNYIAAFDAATGALLTTWNVNLNGSVRSMSLSPDNSRLYIGGQFTTVNGSTKQRAAALNAASGALITGWTANANGSVTALKATANRVYLGGDFSTLSNASRSRIGAVNTTNGGIDATFTASADNRVSTIGVSGNGNRVIIGGSFHTVNGGQPFHGVASLNGTTGASEAWASAGIIPGPPSCSSYARGLRVVGQIAYVSAEGTEPGCWEGIYAANVADGSLIWNSHCLGGTQDVEVVGTWVYKASHQHDCGYNEGVKGSGFVGIQNPDLFNWQRLVAQSTIDGGHGHWSPDTNGGTSEGVGPHVLATDGTQLFVGGDFTNVNGTNQQGITRFQPGNGQAPLTPATAPSVTATAPNTLTITAPGVEDRDSGTLTYSLYQDGSGTALQTKTVESYPWSLPSIRFDVTGLATGSSHTYRVRASDGVRLGPLGAASAAVTVSGTAPPLYNTVQLGVNPASYWKLNDTGATAADLSPNGRSGTFFGGVTRSQGGALAGDNAVTLDGTTGYVSSDAPLPSSSTWTQSVWLKTTTTRGGLLIGNSDAASGLGTAADNVIWMDNNGQVVAGMRSSVTATRTRIQYSRSPYVLNDGQWHHVAASFDGAALNIYVDGRLDLSTPQTTSVPLAAPYLRAGHANLLSFDTVFGNNFSSGQTAPKSFFFAGSLDEAASIPTALSAAQIRSLWQSGIGGGVPPNNTTTTTTSTTTSTSTTTTSTSTTTTSTTTTTIPTGGGNYPATVAADTPSAYWRLNETAGGAVADASGNGRTGTFRTSGLTYGAPGALATGPNTAVQSAGSSGVAYTNTVGAGPSTYSLEAWINTSSVTGGKILGLENVQTGWGTTYDRQLYMTNNGRLAYGIVSGGLRTAVTSAASFNNGQWHHVVATQGATGMTLYVDGVSVGTNPTVTPDAANGFWRIGGGNVTGWANAPSSSALSGSYDEVAVYPSALSAARVSAHFAARAS